MKNKNKKIFVLDTNVILHDSSCIRQFQENDIVIPITVLEELDQFKKGHDTLNYHAREFLRELDSLSGDKLFDGGVKIGTDLGNILVKLEQELITLKQKFAPEHPEVAQKAALLEAMKKRSKELAPGTDKLTGLRTGLEYAREFEKRLREEIEKADIETVRTGRRMLEIQDLRERLESAQAKYDALVIRIRDMKAGQSGAANY